MSVSTLLFLLLLIGLPLAMMLTHRGGAGGLGGCGMDHGGHGHDSDGQRGHGHGDRARTAPTRSAGGTVDLSKSEPRQDDDRGQRGGHGCC